MLNCLFFVYCFIFFFFVSSASGIHFRGKTIESMNKSHIMSKLKTIIIDWLVHWIWYGSNDSTPQTISMLFKKNEWQKKRCHQLPTNSATTNSHHHHTYLAIMMHVSNHNRLEVSMLLNKMDDVSVTSNCEIQCFSFKW